MNTNDGNQAIKNELRQDPKIDFKFARRNVSSRFEIAIAAQRPKRSPAQPLFKNLYQVHSAM